MRVCVCVFRGLHQCAKGALKLQNTFLDLRSILAHCCRLEKQRWRWRPIRTKITPWTDQIWKIQRLWAEIHSEAPFSAVGPVWMTLADASVRMSSWHFGAPQRSSICKLSPVESSEWWNLLSSLSPLPRGYVCPHLYGNTVGAEANWQRRVRRMIKVQALHFQCFFKSRKYLFQSKREVGVSAEFHLSKKKLFIL